MTETLRAPIEAALTDAIARIEAIDPGDAFDPRVPEAIVAAGLHLLPVPAERGGLGATMTEVAQVLARLGAVDGSTALGFAMHAHVVGSVADSDGWSPAALDRLYRGGRRRRSAGQRGLDRGGRRFAGPWRDPGDDRYARRRWRLAADRREDLDHLAAGAAPRARERPIGRAPAATTEGATTTEAAPRRRRSASSWSTSRHPASSVAPVSRPSGCAARRPAGWSSTTSLSRPRRSSSPGPAGAPDPRGVAPVAWFGCAVAATYLGVGEGARRDVARWALERRPGDGSTAVADIPSVQLRLGRADATLRAARIVVLDATRRWDAASDAPTRAALLSDFALAKVTATSAAVTATDEALRIAGGPGFLAGRLERAFRDARAGLINPPLEDVALTGFAKTVLDRERAS